MRTSAQLEIPIASPPLPANRGECVNGPRPCPSVHCRHHLGPDDERRGKPHEGRSAPKRVLQRAETCALDIADRYPDGLSRDAVATLLGVDPERVRQIEERGTLKYRAGLAMADATEEVRSKLPEGTALHVVYENSTHSGLMAVTLVVRVAQDGKARSAGGVNSRANATVQIRRKVGP